MATASAASLNVQLRNGVSMPSVGLGTFKSAGADVVHAVSCALRGGVRHIDTAQIYKNEALVLQGLQTEAATVRRQDVFVTSKVSPYQQGTDKARQACEAMLSALGGPPVDLALIHWPGASGVPVRSADNARLRLETWRVLEDYYTTGKFRAIGVSNFEITHLTQLMEQARVPPMVNQIEVHPRRPCTAVREFCAAQGIVVVAYTPLGAGDLVAHPVVARLAAQHACTPAQVLLAWSLAKGCVVIPKSVRAERIAEFAAVATGTVRVVLGAQDIAQLDSLEDGHKYAWNPADVV